MKISVISEDRKFTAHLQYAILDCGGYDYYTVYHERLVAASFVGLNSEVKAIQASIISGYGTIIEAEQRQYYCNTGNFKRITTRPQNGVVHGMVLDVNAVYSKKTKYPVIIATNGDIAKAVGRYVTARYSLPQEWEHEYYSLIRDRVQTLITLVDKEYSPWPNLAAVKLLDVDQSLIEERLEEALKVGRITIPPSSVKGRFDPSWTVQEYIKANASILAERISKVKAAFDPDKDELSPHLATMERIPFPAQAYAIQGIYNILKEKKVGFVAGEMGTGKTEIALGIIHLLREHKNIKRVLITAPGMVIPKWGREIQETIPYAKVRVIQFTKQAIRFIEEVKKNRNPNHLEIVLVSIDRVKLGPEPWYAVIWKRVQGESYYAFHCPECYKPLPAEDALKDLKENLKINDKALPYICAGWNELVEKPARPPAKNSQPADNLLIVPRPTPSGLPEGSVIMWKKKNKLKKCPYCEAKLFRPALKNRGETRIHNRWYICKILNKLGKIFDLYIADEVHQTKAGNSGRGYAFAKLVKASNKVVALTGTLTNGKSSSIKEVLWRTDPQSLISDGFNYSTNIIKWAERYGVIERVVSRDDVEFNDEGIITIRKGMRARLKEMPGISPELTVNYLLDKTVFLDLSDLGLPLVSFKEKVKFIDMDEELAKCYTKLHEQLYDACKIASFNGKPGAFSQFIPTTINYADRPDLGASVEIDGEIITAPKFSENYYHAKERVLVEIVRDQLARQRKVIIYTNYSNKYSMNQRVKKVLNDHGIDCTILPASVPPEKRMEWLYYKGEKKGTQVIICNLEVVQVGLDILFAQTAIFYQLSYKVNDIRQSGRRIWRLFQTRNCEVYYLVYNGTQQIAQFKHVMAGRGQALFVEGRLDRSELKEYAIMDEKTSMAYSITQCLAESDLADKWTKLAEKDRDQDIKIIDEENFIQELEKAILQQTIKTLRLCNCKDKNKILELENKLANIDKPQIEFEDPKDLIDQPETVPTLFDFCKWNNTIKTAAPVTKVTKNECRPKKKNNKTLQLTLFDCANE